MASLEREFSETLWQHLWAWQYGGTREVNGIVLQDVHLRLGTVLCNVEENGENVMPQP